MKAIGDAAQEKQKPFLSGRKQEQEGGAGHLSNSPDRKEYHYKI